jgi:hypothetical protein
MIINEKLNLKNFLHDAMDFHAVRQLMVKSRHKILMPTLVLHLTKTKLNQGEYRSSYGRNLHERTDRPVFTIEEAVGQLKTHDPTRTDVEKAMDEFFMTHLPEQVIKTAGDHKNNELDEDAVRRVKRSEVPTKKNRSQTELRNVPPAFLRNRSHSRDKSEVKKKKQKSDLTLAFINSSEQVAKLAYQSEVGQKIETMRTVAKSQHRVSPPAPRSQFGRANEGIQTASSQRNIRKRRETWTPLAFNKRFSQDSSIDLAMMNRIDSIVAERQTKHRPTKHMKYSAPSGIVSTVKETNKEDPALGDIVSTVKENATKWSDPEKSESLESFDSDAIGKLDFCDDAGRENTPSD